MYKGGTAKSWVSQITVDAKKYCLGTFATEEEAAAAYNAAVRHFKLPEWKLNAEVERDEKNFEDMMRAVRRRIPAKYRGVYKRGKTWLAQIRVKGKVYFLGTTFAKEEEAAAAYNAAARHFNFPAKKLNAGVSEDNTALENFLRRQDKVKNANYKTARYRGVHKGLTAKSWVAQITVRGKRYCLGSFETEEEAAAAYNAASRQFNLPESRLNAGVAEDGAILDKFNKKHPDISA